MSKDRLPSQRQAVILSILIHGEKYGRKIRNEYENSTRRKMPLGSLYTTLNRMETYGFVKSRLGESTHERGGNKRKYFRITAYGEQALDTLKLFVNELLDGILNTTQ